MWRGGKARFGLGHEMGAFRPFAMLKVLLELFFFCFLWGFAICFVAFFDLRCCCWLECGCRVSPRRASNFSLAREKSPKARWNSGAHDRTHFAPKALRSGNYRESDQKPGGRSCTLRFNCGSASIATEKRLTLEQKFNSSCGLHPGISRSREMQHEQREVP